MHMIVERTGWLRSPCATLAMFASLTVGSLGLLRLVDPRIPGNYPTCPFLFLTGCYCPGCGTLRALATLMEGDLRGAMGYNPLTVLSLPFLAVLTSSMLSEKVERFPRIKIHIPPWAVWTLLAAILSFWALRNVPLAPFAMLAP